MKYFNKREGNVVFFPLNKIRKIYLHNLVPHIRKTRPDASVSSQTYQQTYKKNTYNKTGENTAHRHNEMGIPNAEQRM